MEGGGEQPVQEKIFSIWMLTRLKLSHECGFPAETRVTVRILRFNLDTRFRLNLDTRFSSLEIQFQPLEWLIIFSLIGSLSILHQHTCILDVHQNQFKVQRQESTSLKDHLFSLQSHPHGVEAWNILKGNWIYLAACISQCRTFVHILLHIKYDCFGGGAIWWWCWYI